MCMFPMRDSIASVKPFGINGNDEANGTIKVPVTLKRGCKGRKQPGRAGRMVSFPSLHLES